MGQKLIIGEAGITKGLQTNVLPFNVDNDAFPVLVNAYQWRGRVKRKRGTSMLSRLQRAVSISASLSSDDINLISSLSLESSSTIVPGSINIVGSDDGTTYTDPAKNSILLATGGTGTGGSINYASGLLSINAGGNQPISGTFSYYPGLPVMGEEDWVRPTDIFPGTIAFDTTYSYNVSTSSPYYATDVSFYKNPPSSGSYTAKSSITPCIWNGENYQQFWSTNYQGALWVTNGVDVPFQGNTCGLQFQKPITYTYGSATTMVFVIVNCPLVVGDYVYANEFATSTATNAQQINFQTGYVTIVEENTPEMGQSTVTVKFPNAVLVNDTYTSGILLYLTNTSDNTVNPIRWFDGDPTDSSGLGWVNFMPPLSQNLDGIADLPEAQYYLAGAKMIVPFKDRLLFIGAVVQSSTTGPFYLQDTVIYSQNGTPYYTASWDNTDLVLDLPNAEFNSLLVPNNQTAFPPAWFADQTGFGGNQPAGLDQPIVTAGLNEDALILGFGGNYQTRFIYTGNDITPFSFYIINAEYPSNGTFSGVTTDDGVFSYGNKGFIFTNQTSATRFDIPILPNVYNFVLTSNGNERVCAQRDFINEWIYFTYLSNSDANVFPNQTLQYNYRDNTWAVFNENYTTYGTFRKTTGDTWDSIALDPEWTWDNWEEPWDDGVTELRSPEIIAGNQQGFIMLRDQGTGEGTSLFIQGISSNTITSPNHCLNDGDYIQISGCLGTISSFINGNIYQVQGASTNSFMINLTTTGSPTYLGGGLITRFYIPLILSKEFPASWTFARKTRIGPQQYLFTATPNAQVTLLIYLSTANVAFNQSPIIPDPASINDSLVYSTVLYTCPESTNLGLTPVNVNLQQINEIDSTGVSANPQRQIWHRMNTSLIGDTVQIGITLSPDQMTILDGNGALVSQTAEIELHAFIMDISPAGMLA